MATAGRPEYSLVVPIYNEEDTVPELARRLAALLEQLDGTAEVILVDDGSSDSSYERMVAARAPIRASSSCASRGTSGTRSRSPPGSTSRPATR